ncbi:DNA gyrase inhibitor [Streptomyces spiroverticillatus]|uniref:DNA gyrase inhibitor n=1 Tax=Streptomyces finlayi TaxID=67296 RepID=A0A918WT25_9ACTN|nr:GyrI-like domain-containing protein [Streptomyces finlayi]GGZ89170.1 DNA gyrase inhibitor [Streptomyces spiroverticillatus]GHC80070.1 DNA gyrase inhibitor [Streptomyces finlayi]
MRYEPEITEYGEQPYAGIRGRVRTDGFAAIADRIPELIGWLAARGTEPLGGPFLRYNVIGADGELEVEAGVPVAVAPEPEGDVRAGVLPAGRYATLTHVGHPDELVGVTQELIAWAGTQGLEWDMTRAADGEHWVGRTETFLTDPRVEPDPNKWETRLAIRLADG